MDNKDQNTEKDFEVILDAVHNDEIKLSIQEQIYEIEIKMQEIDAQIEQFEEMIYQSNDEEVDYEQLTILKEEYKKLRAEKKQLTKQNKGMWDKIPVWMFSYGIFQVVLSSYYILFKLSIYFAGWFLGWIQKSTEINRFWEVFSLFFVPFISIMVSVVILILIKEKVRKKFFTVLFSIQVIETIITIILIYNQVKDIWKS